MSNYKDYIIQIELYKDCWVSLDVKCTNLATVYNFMSRKSKHIKYRIVEKNVKFKQLK